MKYKFPIIAIITLGIVVSISLYLTNSETNMLTDPNDFEFGHLIIVTYEPSQFHGLNRDYPIEPIKFTNKDFETIPKLEKTLDYLLQVKTSELREPLLFMMDDEPSQYIISKTGPFTFKADSYLTNNEMPNYVTWVNENLEPVELYELPSVYYLEYQDEVFVLSFETVSVIYN